MNLLEILYPKLKPHKSFCKWFILQELIRNFELNLYVIIYTVHFY